MRGLLLCVCLLSYGLWVAPETLAQCHPQADSPSRSFNPVELTVTPDGRTVFALSKQDESIYRIDADHPPEVMAFYGEPLADCRPGKDLATDAQGHLLFANRLDRYLYLLLPDQLWAFYREKRAAQYFTMPTPYEPAKHAAFSEPSFLQREGSRLYLQLDAPGEQLIRRIHLQNRVSEDLLHRVGDSGQNVLIRRPYTIKASRLYRLQTEQGQIQLLRYTLGSKNFVEPETLALDVPEATRHMNLIPQDIVAGPANLLYFSDSGSHRIWKIRLAANGDKAELSLLAGCGNADFRDGLADQACFAMPSSLSLDAVGNLYVADTWNHAIRKVSPEGKVTTFYRGGSL